ncbi:hypothetical protein Gogos_012887 [Gossypium gossypioides]|uniref:Uncharacterized protein n=1 Tax=Gossypium gossypioides TaxID=34282 RepID=A0A7J9BTZ4_GOSGO|nr:hypothetical protein [Gossypium gossypioides]
MNLLVTVEDHQYSFAIRNQWTTGVSGAGNQSSETNLFASWFADRLESLGNLAHAGASNSLDLNIPSGQGLSFPSDQEASPQQFVALQEQLKLMREQMGCLGFEAARGGMETLRPALQRLYMTRAFAYRDALKSFIEGYQEGVQQIMEKKEYSSKAQQEGNTDKSST